MTASILAFRLVSSNKTAGRKKENGASQILQKRRSSVRVRPVQISSAQYPLYELPHRPEEAGRKQRRGRQCENPGQSDVANGGQLQTATVRHHGSGNTRGEHVRRG